MIINGGTSMKMNLKLKDIMKINHLFEVAEDNDTTIIIGKKGRNLYMMNEKTYSSLMNSKEKCNAIREKEIRHQSGKQKNSKSN